jgi:hypothetical protein
MGGCVICQAVRLPEIRSLGRALAINGMLGAILFAWSRPAFAQQAVNSTPTEVLEARAHYEEAMAVVAKPIRERYLAELEQLENTAYRTRNFDLAKAVTQEISLMETATAGDDAMSPEDRIMARMINTTWVWGSGQTLTFLAGGKARWSVDSAARFTWKVTGAAPAAIEGQTSDGGKFWINLDGALRTGNVIQGRAQRPTSRIEFRF